MADGIYTRPWAWVGEIDDANPSSTTTYSGNKIETELDEKQEKITWTVEDNIAIFWPDNEIVDSWKKTTEFSPTWHSHTAATVSLSTTNFGWVLDDTIINLQLLADFIDDEITFWASILFWTSDPTTEWNAWDFYINNTSWDVFYKTASWVNKWNIKWEQGLTWATGAKWATWDTGPVWGTWATWAKWDTWEQWVDYRWPYSVFQTYEPDDLVKSDGSVYICMQTSTWNPVSDAFYWQLFVSKWDTGATGAMWADWDVQTVVWWTNISVDSSDSANPEVNLDDLYYEDVNTSNWIWTPKADLANLQKAFDHVRSTWVTHDCDITDHWNWTVSIWDWTAVLRASTDPHSTLYPVNVDAQWPISLTDDATNYIYLDWNSWSPQFNVSTSIASFNCLDKCIAYVIHRDDNDLSVIDAREQNVDSNRKSRRLFLGFARYIHANWWTVISEKTSLDVVVTAGTFYFMLEDLPHDAFDTSVAWTANENVFDLYYSDWGTGFTKVDDQKVIDPSVYDGGTWTPVALSNNTKYGVTWFYLAHNWPTRLVAVMWQEEYDSQAEAKLAQPPSDVPSLIDWLGSLIWFTVASKIATSFDNVLSAFAQSFTAQASSTHNSLWGLDWWEAGYYGHLSNSAQTIAWEKTFSNELNVSATGSVIRLTDEWTSRGDEETGMTLDFFSNETTLWTAKSVSKIRGFSSNSTGSQWGLAFDVYSSATLFEAMRVDADGSVGIGTSSPWAKLDVNWTWRFSDDLIVDTDTLFVDVSEDKVWINNATPTNSLSIWNWVWTFNWIWLGNSGWNTDFRIWQDWTHNFITGWKYNATANDAYVVLETYAWNNNIAMQTAGGNVWIGTTSPTRKVDILQTWTTESLYTYRDVAWATWSYANRLETGSSDWGYATLLVKQANDKRSLVVEKTWTGWEDAVQIVNSWTWSWLLIDQNWNWVALNIANVWTGQSLLITHSWNQQAFAVNNSWIYQSALFTRSVAWSSANVIITNSHASDTQTCLSISNAWSWSWLLLGWAWATIEMSDVTAPSTTTNKLYSVWWNVYRNWTQLN